MAFSRTDTGVRIAAVAPHAARYELRPAIVFQAMVLALFLANLGRIPVLSTGEREAPILVNDLCVGCMIGIGGLVALRARAFRLDAVALLGLAFAGVGAASAILSVPRFGLGSFELVVSLAYLARWVWYFAIYVAIINAVSERDALALWTAGENVLLAFAIFGIFQSAFLPGFAQMVYPNAREYYDWDVQGHRLVSTVLEPNIASGMLLLGLLVALGRVAAGAVVARWKLIVLFAALVLTLSRSGALSFVVGCVVILLARGLSKRLLRAAIAIAVVTAAALPLLLKFAAGYNKLGFDASAAARLVSWLHAWQVFASNPLIGVGFNTFGYVLERAYSVERFGAASYSSDGGLLFIAAMTGLVGLFFYVGMLVVVFRRCRRIWRSASASRDQRGFAFGVAASLVAICIHSVFVNSLLTPLVMELLWVQWALVFVVGRSLRD